MSTIEIVRHGERWAVREAGETPLEEYETRELAEVAARQLARERGGEVVVRDPGDEQLGAGGVAPASETEEPEPQAPEAAELGRERQAGL